MFKTHPSLFLVVPNPLLVKQLVPPLIKRTFKPGVRRGKDKSLTKFYRVNPVYVPSKDLLVDKINGAIHCHPDYYSTLLREMPRFTTEIPVGVTGTLVNRVTGWRDDARKELLSSLAPSEWKLKVTM